MDKMKNIYTIIATAVMLIGMSTISLYAGNSIDREISKIKSASPKERVRLMNELKRRIFKLNREQRIRAIRKLRKSIPVSAHAKRVSKPKQSKVTEHKSITEYPHNMDSIRERIEMSNHHAVTAVAHEMGNPSHHVDKIKSMIEQNIVKPVDKHTDIIETPYATVPEQNHQDIPVPVTPAANTASEILSEASKIASDTAGTHIDNVIKDTVNKGTVSVDMGIRTDNHPEAVNIPEDKNSVPDTSKVINSGSIEKRPEGAVSQPLSPKASVPAQVQHTTVAEPVRVNSVKAPVVAPKTDIVTEHNLAPAHTDTGSFSIHSRGRR